MGRYIGGPRYVAFLHIGYPPTTALLCLSHIVFLCSRHFQYFNFGLKSTGFINPSHHRLFPHDVYMDIIRAVSLEQHRINNNRAEQRDIMQPLK